MVNSSWTEKHILDLWQIPFRTHRVYPPCEVSHLKNLEHTESDKIVILSVAQFRPEKDHPLQLQTMYELREKLRKNEELWEKVCVTRLSAFTVNCFSLFYFVCSISSVEISDYWIVSGQRR